MMKQNTKTTLTPLEQLRAEKLRLRAESKCRQQRLAEDFQYIQDNAGSMLMSGLTSLIFPGSKTKQPKEEKAAEVGASEHSFDLSDMMSLASGAVPLLWSLAQPVILTWGAKKIKTLLSSLFFRKKKK